MILMVLSSLYKIDNESIFYWISNDKRLDSNKLVKDNNLRKLVYNINDDSK